MMKKVPLASCIFLLTILASCNFLDGRISSDLSLTATANSVKGTENQNWIIFTAKQVEKMGIEPWHFESDGFWTPSADDILKLEGKLTDFLVQNSSVFYREPPVWQRLDQYQRQFIGLERGGRQIIYGNYFCSSSGVDWRHGLFIVADGGDCYFQVEFDWKNALFIKLLVNGES